MTQWEMTIFKFKKLSDLATAPTKGSKDAAGYDLYAATDKEIEVAPHQTVKIPTDIAIEGQTGIFGGVFPRSGLSTKKGLRLANCVAVIDADFRGGIMVPIYNDSDSVQVIQPKERIAQLVFLPYFSCTLEEVDELDSTERGEGGFGSTGEL